MNELLVGGNHTWDRVLIMWHVSDPEPVCAVREGHVVTKLQYLCNKKNPEFVLLIVAFGSFLKLKPCKPLFNTEVTQTDMLI